MRSLHAGGMYATSHTMHAHVIAHETHAASHPATASRGMLNSIAPSAASTDMRSDGLGTGLTRKKIVILLVVPASGGDRSSSDASWVLVASATCQSSVFPWSACALAASAASNMVLYVAAAAPSFNGGP